MRLDQMKVDKSKDRQPGHAAPFKASWFDASGILSWGAQPPTGIQRVEQTIYKHCRNHPDFGIAVYNGSLRDFEPATETVLAYLDHIADADPQSGADMRQRRRNAFAFIGIQLAYSANETARRLAQAMTGFGPRSGASYGIAKSVMRLAGWGVQAGHAARSHVKRLTRALAGPGQSPFLAGATLLVSHQVARNESLLREMDRSGLVPVFLVHDLIPVLQPEMVSDRFSQKMERFINDILRTSRSIITISAPVRQDILDWNRDHLDGVYDRPIKVCPLGNALIDSKNRTRPIALLEGKKFALYCSTMERRKRHDVLVMVWARLARLMPSESLPDLVFIGRKDTGLPAISSELAASPQIAAKVHLLSEIDDPQLHWAYRHACIGLFPSSSEGWGLGVSESLALGLPIVHSQLPSLLEASQGLMPSLPVGDVDAWTTCLAELFNNPSRIEELRMIAVGDYVSGAPDAFASSIAAELLSQSTAALG